MPVEKKETIKNKMLEALNRLDDFRELAFPDLYQPKKRAESGKEAEREARDTDLRVASEEDQKSTDKSQDRTPQKTQKTKAKFIMVGGKKFKFDFFLQNLSNDRVDKETVINEEHVIEIYINTGFKGYTLTRDTEFYTTFHVAEAIAEIYVKEAKQKTERIFELRNTLIHEVAAVILEEEEYKKLEKTESELVSIKYKKKEIEDKRKMSKLTA